MIKPMLAERMVLIDNVQYSHLNAEDWITWTYKVQHLYSCWWTWRCCPPTSNFHVYEPIIRLRFGHSRQFVVNYIWLLLDVIYIGRLLGPLTPYKTHCGRYIISNKMRPILFPCSSHHTFDKFCGPHWVALFGQNQEMALWTHLGC